MPINLVFKSPLRNLLKSGVKLKRETGGTIDAHGGCPIKYELAMTEKTEKLKWERVGEGFDLRLINHKDANTKEIRKMLANVERPNPEYDKPFSKDASQYFRKWFTQPDKLLNEASYCLLSNWFLTECSSSKSTRAFHAGNLWDALFCERPKSRLTNWRISNRKVVPDKFKEWWTKQQECQET